jgi:hypothetical protein
MLNETMTESGMRIWHALPDDSGAPRPVVLLLHERYGPVEHSFNFTAIPLVAIEEVWHGSHKTGLGETFKQVERMLHWSVPLMEQQHNGARCP